MNPVMLDTMNTYAEGITTIPKVMKDSFHSFLFFSLWMHFNLARDSLFRQLPVLVIQMYKKSCENNKINVLLHL